MSSASGKKEFFYIVVLILTFITVVIGATYALYYFLYSFEEGGSAVYTGNLKIEYKNGEIINSHNLRPRVCIEDEEVKENEEDKKNDCPTFETVDNVYRNNFSVTNTGSLDSDIDIIVDFSKNVFPDKSIMFSLYDEDKLYSDEDKNDEDKEIINNGYMEGLEDIYLAEGLSLESGETKKFILVVWWNDENFNQNPGAGCDDADPNPGVVCDDDDPDNNNLEEYVLVGMIKIDASQQRK